MRRLGLPRPTIVPALACLALAGLVAGCDVLGWANRTDLLVLARRGDETSRAIADYYAALHDLPSDRILELSLTIPPDARRIDAETYQREIAAPIERHLQTSDPDGEVTLLVTTRGLPLVVEACDGLETARCERASLDAALAQLGRTSDEHAFARRPNPYFRETMPFARFRADRDDSALRFLVARLTAPLGAGEASGEPPRRIIEALEKHNAEPTGATGWRVDVPAETVDHNVATRLLLDPIAENLQRYGHSVCSPCDGSEDAARPSGIVLLAPNDGHEATGVEHLTSPGLVISLGATPEENDGQRASAFDRFVSRWIARGARALSLHLDDTNLGLVARPADQLVAWARGATAVEAHYRSLPQLGSVQVFVGDPFLRLGAKDSKLGSEDDRDGDGLTDAEDNCPADANPDQRDTNEDGFGNRCDADVDDDGWVGTSNGAIYPVDARGDLEAIALTALNGPYEPDHDLDGDGRVDERDLVIARLALGRPPGR